MEQAEVKLATLTELLADSVKGYKRLCEGLEDQEHILFCLEESSVRDDYRRKLEQLRLMRFGQSDGSGTLIGRVHRGWIEMETTLNMSDRVLLGTALHCEALAITSYEALLEEAGLDSEMRVTLEHQVRHVRSVHVRLQQMKEHSPDKVFQSSPAPPPAV